MLTVDTATASPITTTLAQDAALLRIGRFLQQSTYRFTTVTPATHAIIEARSAGGSASDLRGVFGWNLPFAAALLPEDVQTDLALAHAVEWLPDGRLRARVRFSTMGDLLVLHSGYPTTAPDAVFFGPDTYRFIALLRRTLRGGGRLLEIGAGTGAAALALADRYQVQTLTDINPLAVRYARLNAKLADCSTAEVVCSDLAAQVTGTFDAVIANPPYLIDPAHRLYRDGGRLGIEVALNMVMAALPHLAEGGRLVLYTGAPVVDGQDRLAEALRPLITVSGLPARYEEIDVDVFGSDLATPSYAAAGIERVAVVALVMGGDHRRPIEDGESDIPAWSWP